LEKCLTSRRYDEIAESEGTFARVPTKIKVKEQILRGEKVDCASAEESEKLLAVPRSGEERA